MPKLYDLLLLNVYMSLVPTFIAWRVCSDFMGFLGLLVPVKGSKTNKLCLAQALRV